MIPTAVKRSKAALMLIASVPAGTIPVLIGLLVSGIAAYGFLSLTAHILGPAKYGSISALWSVVFIVGPGIFLPFQQFLTHEFSYQGANSLGSLGLVRRTTLLASILTLSLLLIIWVTTPELKRYLFDGNSQLVVGFGLALVGYSMMFIIFGILAGSGRFGILALGQGLDGTLRLLICAVLATVGVTSAGPYGLVFGAIPILVTIVLLGPNLHLLRVGPPVNTRAMSTSLTWLIIGSVGSQFLVNGSVISFKVLSTHIDQTQVGSFVAGVVLARIPLFLFGAVQSTLLPRLSAHSHKGEYRQLNKSIILTSALVAAIGILCTLGIFTLGPWALSVFFGHQFILTRLTMSILAGTISIYMLAMVAAQGLIALKRAAFSAIGWVIGSLVFVIFLFTNFPLLARIEIAYLAGTACSLFTEIGLYWFALNSAMRQTD